MAKTRVDTPATALDPAPVRWAPGTRFSGYEIESQLAAGGMAEVWRAKLKGVEGFEKRVVIKTMLTSLQHRPELVEMFVNEAALAARLNHPNIVDIFDFGQMEGRYFIAMSYVPGLTLRLVNRRLHARGERLPVAAALHVLRDVCDALQHIHELEDGEGPLRLVHRDVSPDNIILSTSGTAKLIDFGAARATARTPPSRLFVGRYRYAAPERLRHQDEDHRSDVYSVGVILYECLTGTRRFDGSDAEIMNAVIASPACDPRAVVPSLPSNVAHLVKKATANDPRDRFESARDLGAALGRCLLQVEASSREPEVTAALAAVLENAPEPAAPEREREAVPLPLEGSHPSSSAIALSEREILEASGPIRAPAAPTDELAGDTQRIDLPLPPEAFLPPRAPATLEDAVRGATAPTVEGAARDRGRPSFPGGRLVEERAVELFDRGISLRAQQRYEEALDAWEQAQALAPANLVYQANVARLRAQLDELRRASK